MFQKNFETNYIMSVNTETYNGLSKANRKPKSVIDFRYTVLLDKETYNKLKNK